jgi:hypothetical protein
VNWDFVSKLYDMKVETKLLETNKMKEILSEGKSEMCSSSENEFYRTLFNTNQDVKWIYMNGINKIMREVFSENFIENPGNNQMSGVYELEGPGRSVINKLNTNYTSFCILLNDVNQVIKKLTKKPPIDFRNKNTEEQKKEASRFISAINHYKFQIFNRESSTFQNLLRVLIEKNAAGSKREEITASILRRYFGKGVKVEIVGELGSKKDAISGVDIEITKDGVTKTAQVKPFREKKITDNGILLEGTASVKIYKTDLMIFQKGKNVLVFNEKPIIVNGNFLFPLDSLLYDIQ